MVVIRLAEWKGDQVIYEYFPEGKETKGLVAYSRKKRERTIIESAEGYSNIYAQHALKRIKEYDTLDDFKKEDMIAWY